MRLLIVGGLQGQIGLATKIAMDKGAKVGVVATPTPVEPFARRTRRRAYLHITLVITHPDGFAV